MKGDNFKITEWATIITLTIGLYCYLYNYIYWKYFGINAYDYFSYIDSLQRSVPLLIFALVIINVILLLLFSLLLMAKKNTLRFFRFQKRLNKEVSSRYYLVLSVVSLFLFVFGSSFVMPVLRVDSFSYEVKETIIVTFFVLFTALYSSTISLFAFVRSVERKNKLKHSIMLFFIFPIPFQIIMSIFFMPVWNAYTDENKIRAQVIIRSGDVRSSYKMLALTKDFVFAIDDKNVVVRKISDVEYIYYRVENVR